MKTMIVLLTLLTFAATVGVASADRSYATDTQQAWKHEMAAQVKAKKEFDAIAAEASKGMPRVALPDVTFYGTGPGWGTAAAAGRGAGAPRTTGPTGVRVWGYCPGYY
ncbi:MAG: hypothetical protein LDL33_05765 [Desulfomonile sp.]|nr:hypothetical protein [Desulfomonile sp.]